MRLGQNDDGAQALRLKPVVSAGDSCQSRCLGGGQENRLHGRKIVERVRLSPTDLVVDRTQAHRTHASTVATWQMPDKRGEIPILTPPPSKAYGGHAVVDEGAGLLADSTSAAPVDRAVTIAP